MSLRETKHTALSTDGPEVPKPEWRVPVALLVLGLLMTGTGVWYSHQATLGSRQRQFDSLVTDAVTTITRRVDSHTEILYGLRSLHLTNEPLTREQFHQYLKVADVQGRALGARAISFNRQIKGAQRATFEESVRNDNSLSGSGYPSFRVHPTTQNELLYVVDYLEPLEGNEATFGYDTGSDPVRRSAIEHARDAGTPVATAPVRLLQGPFKGFLLLLAAYDREDIPATAPARRRAFSGVFAAVFSLDKMMDGVLGTNPKVNVEIYDIGLTVNSQPLALNKERALFDSNHNFDALQPSIAAQPNRFQDINIAERRWRIFATPGPGFSAGSAPAIPLGVGLTGIALSLLVSGLVYSFARSRRVAVGLAIEMTASLRESESELSGATIQLEMANRELHDVNQAMKDFVATAAHELRSPLTSVLGFSSTLTKSWDSLSDEQKRDYTTVIERQAMRLARLIDDLLTLSRIEAGALQSHIETISVKDVISEAVEYYSQEFPGIQVSVDDRLLVLADPEQLRRIVANFVGNAVKYGAPPVFVEAFEDERFVEIKVRDYGEGVPKDFVPRLFNRFSRAETLQTRNSAGTGLGLSIVGGLARANGGEIWYEPNQPQGSCFGIRFPKP
ncbi:MAG: CHASE domain-containing protein [Actinomycetota bacterium]